MKRARDFRAIARSALSGRWVIAVVAGLIAALLGGISSGGGININNFNGNGAESSMNMGEQLLLNDEIMAMIAAVAGVVILIVLVVAAVFIFLGSVVSVGYSKFNLDLVDRENEPELNTLFGYFKNWKTAVGASLLQGLFILLGTLLFVIPGIIAIYNYAMLGFVLAENPELSAGEALRRSKEIMRGNRWRLFCLEMSFIGWGLLCVLTLGIGNLWLKPYQYASFAAFYREISGTERIISTTELA